MIEVYVTPTIATQSDFYFSAVTQNYFDIPSCNQLDFTCENGTASGAILFCASGIADPSEFNTCFLTRDCGGFNEDINLTGCVDGGFLCPAGSIPVECDFTGSCNPDCILQSSGITCDGEFEPCPQNGIIIGE